MIARAAFAVFALAVVLTGGGAQAGDLAPIPLAATPAAHRPPLDISLPGDISAGRSDAARTAVDHRFAGQSLVGQIGYLCGLDRYAPNAAGHGGGPGSVQAQSGTFLGASLGYAFH